MKPLGPATAIRAEIVGYYKKATYCYAAPFGLLFLSFLVPFAGQLAFFSLLPLGLVGLLFTKRGLALATKSGDREKKDVGYANLVLGIIILVLGLLLLGIIYLRMG
jgi:uncharacterized membrane protein